jgi:hypothetical protein
MAKAKRDPLMRSLEHLVGDHSMPEVVAALVRLSRAYKEQLQSESISESQGWQSREPAVSTAR